MKGLPVFLQSLCALKTRRCIQETQKTLRMTSPTVPNQMPEFLRASGMANIPVPMFPFSRWMIVSQFLKRKKNKVWRPKVQSRIVVRRNRGTFVCKWATFRKKVWTSLFLSNQSVNPYFHWNFDYVVLTLNVTLKFPIKKFNLNYKTVHFIELCCLLYIRVEAF